MKYTTSTEAQTKELASHFVSLFKKNHIFALYGPLGSGKTTFAQGLMKSLGVAGKISSPTFLLMKEYILGEYKLYHVDLYRLGGIQEIVDLGLLSLMQEENNLFIIEWSEKMESLLPQEAVKFYFSYVEGGHSIEVSEEKAKIDSSWYQKPAGEFLVREAAGGVVVRREGEILLIALCHEGAVDKLVLPKGGIDPGETAEEAAKREVGEEAGATELTTLAKLGIKERLNINKSKWVRQHFFLFVTEQEVLRPTETEHMYVSKWYDLENLPEIFWQEQAELLSENKAKIKSLVNKHYAART